MTKVNLTVDRGEVELGQEITGRVTWQLGGKEVQALVVTMVVVVTGRGSPYAKTLMHLDLPTPHGQGHQEFTVQVPVNAVPTFAGNLFKVNWELCAALDVKLGIDRKATVPITVYPIGWSQLAADQQGDAAPDVHPLNTLPIIDPDAPS